MAYIPSRHIDLSGCQAQFRARDSGRVNDGQTNSVLFDLFVWPSSAVPSQRQRTDSTDRRIMYFFTYLSGRREIARAIFTPSSRHFAISCRLHTRWTDFFVSNLVFPACPFLYYFLLGVSLLCHFRCMLSATNINININMAGHDDEGL